jgi:hypothetical protein
MNRYHAIVLAALAALALGGCTPDFEPASKIDKLRVVAIRAEPPEIEPADAPSTVAPDRATLESLVLRADFDADPVRTTTIVHLACLPEPGNPVPTACQTFEGLRDLGALVADVAATACAPDPASATSTGKPFLVGVEACGPESCGEASASGSPLRRAELVAPSGYFDALAAVAPGHPDLILGVQVVVLAFAIDAAPEELVQGVVPACAEADLVAGLMARWSSDQHVLATKRVHIRGPNLVELEPEMERNRNPTIDGLVAGVTTLDPGGATTVAGGTVNLRPVWDDAERQLYTKRDASGDPIETLREEWVYSWFSTAGELDELHTSGGEADEWIVSGTPEGRPALVAAVVRDVRGGTGWQVRRVSLVR